MVRRRPYGTVNPRTVRTVRLVIKSDISYQTCTNGVKTVDQEEPLPDTFVRKIKTIVRREPRSTPNQNLTVTPEDLL